MDASIFAAQFSGIFKDFVKQQQRFQTSLEKSLKNIDKSLANKILPKKKEYDNDNQKKYLQGRPDNIQTPRKVVQESIKVIVEDISKKAADKIGRGDPTTINTTNTTNTQSKGGLLEKVLGGLFSGAAYAAGGVAGGVASVVSGVVSKILGGRFKKLGGRFKKLGGRFKKLRGVAGDVFKKLGDKFKKLGGRFKKLGGRFKKLGGRFKILRGVAGDVFKKLGDKFKKLSGVAGDAFKKLGGRFKKLSGRFKKLSGRFKKLSGVAGDAFKKLGGRSKKLGGVAGGAFKTLGGVAGGAFKKLGGVAGGAFKKLGGVAGGAFKKLGGVAGGVFKTLGGVLKPFLRRLPLVGLLISIGQAISKFKKGGTKNIISGLLDLAAGISYMFSGLGTVIGLGIDGLNYFFEKTIDKGEGEGEDEGEDMLFKRYKQLRNRATKNFGVTDQEIQNLMKGAGVDLTERNKRLKELIKSLKKDRLIPVDQTEHNKNVIFETKDPVNPVNDFTIFNSKLNGIVMGNKFQEFNKDDSIIGFKSGEALVKSLETLISVGKEQLQLLQMYLDANKQAIIAPSTNNTNNYTFNVESSVSAFRKSVS